MSGPDEVRPNSTSILVPFGQYAGTPLRDLPEAYLATLTDSDSHAFAYASSHYPNFLRAAEREWRRRGALRRREFVECSICHNTTDTPVHHDCDTDGEEIVVCSRCRPRHVCVVEKREEGER